MHIAGHMVSAVMCIAAAAACHMYTYANGPTDWSSHCVAGSYDQLVTCQKKNSAPYQITLIQAQPQIHIQLTASNTSALSQPLL